MPVKKAAKKNSKKKITSRKKKSTKPNGKSSPKQIEIEEKQIQALRLRKSGAAFADIAQSLGYAHASSAYKAVMTQLGKLRQEPGTEVLKLELERLDSYLLALSPKVKRGETKAIEVAIKIGERRARLIGLDNVRYEQELDKGDLLFAMDTDAGIRPITIKPGASLKDIRVSLGLSTTKKKDTIH